MEGNGAGSVKAEFVLDLRQLDKDLAAAQRKIQQFQKRNSGGGSKGGVGIPDVGGGSGAGKSGGAGGGAEAAAGLAGMFGKGAAGALKLAGGIGIAVTAALALVQAGQAVGAAFTKVAGAVGNSIAGAANIQQLDTSIGALAANTGVSQTAVEQFSAKLRELNLAGGETKQSILNLLSAQVPLNDSTFGLVQAAQNLAVAYGTTTTGALSTITDAIGSLNPTLLENFGITENLPSIYERYGASIGVAGDALSEAQKRQALMNAVLERGASFAGIAALANGNVGRSFEILKSNIQNISAGLGAVFLPAISAILTPLVNLSRTINNFVSDNSGKFEALGQILAAKVTPYIQSVQNAFNNIDWQGVANGAYVTAQVLQLIGRYLIATAKSAFYMGQIIFGVMRVIGTAIAAVISVVVGLAQAASQMWAALTGKQSVGTAIKNIGQIGKGIATGIGGEFGEAFKMIGGGVTGYVDNIVDFYKGAAADINQIGQGFDLKAFWEGLPNIAKKSISGAAGATNQGLGQMDAATRKKLADLAKDLADEQAKFAEESAKRAKDYERSLAELVAKHRDQTDSIRKDIKKETAAFNKGTEERTDKYLKEQKRIAEQDRERKDDVNTQIAEELAKGRFADQAKLASLRARLKYEDSETKAASAENQETFDTETAAAKEAYDEKLSALQTSLDAELAIQKQYGSDFAKYADYVAENDIAQLKRNYAEQNAEAAKDHAKKMADLAARGAEIVGQNGANGAAAGNAFTSGLGGAIGAGIPAINGLTNSAGQQAGENTKAGMNNKKQSIGDTFRNILANAAAGAAIGSLFGPVGTAVGATVGAFIGGTGGSVKDGLRRMFDTAINIFGNLNDLGRQLIGKVGAGIKSALGAAGGAFQNAWNGAGFPRFATGGIVGGLPGVDRNMAMVTKGEMILNNTQQQRMFDLLNGGAGFDTGDSITNNAGSTIIENMQISLPGVRNADDFTRDLKAQLRTMRGA